MRLRSFLAVMLLAFAGCSDLDDPDGSGPDRPAEDSGYSGADDSPSPYQPSDPITPLIQPPDRSPALPDVVPPHR